MRAASKYLSNTQAWVREVFPVFTSVIHTVMKLNFTSDTKCLQESLADEINNRVEILFAIKQTLQYMNGCQIEYFQPN